VFAPACVACGRVLSEPTRGVVCDDCRAAIRRFLPPLCADCGVPVLGGVRCSACDGRPAPSLIRAARAVGPYEGVLRDLIHALKYDARRSLAAHLGRLMREAGAGVLRGADLAVPVPLHRTRLSERGFNQALDLAKHLALPVVSALARTRATPSQTGLSGDLRARNVHQAFALRRDASVLRDRVIVLVDDVWTTGATVEACARALQAADAREVRALTVARAL
jgi:ComF family protein